MKGYKGFDKDFKCKDLQYEVGKTFTHTGEVLLCSSGLHFCENPLDVLRYYQPATSRYAEVEAEGVSENKEDDSKRVSSSLHVKAEITLSALIGIGVKFLLNKTTTVPTSGNYSHAATSGNYSPAATSGNSSHAATSGNSSPAATSGNSSHAATSGNYSPAATSGNYSHAATSGYSSPAATAGKESIAASLGREGKAKAALGSWIVLAEYKCDSLEVLSVKTAKVDGKKIKADTFYELKKGKFVVCK